MASGTFRSNSSASTTLSVNIYEVARPYGHQVTFRCDWSVTTGSATSLGSATDRTLYIKDGGGNVVASHLIKDNVTWNESSTYTGSFDFTIELNTYEAGTWTGTPSTSSEGTQSCIWTTYVSALTMSYSQTWTAAGAPTGLSASPNYFEDSVTFSWTKGADGAYNAITDYHVYYSINDGAETGVAAGNNSSYVLNTNGLARGAKVRFHVAAIAPHGNVWSGGYSGYVYKNKAPNQMTSPSVPKTSYIPGETIRVSFSNTGDPDGNLSGVEVATDQNETIVGTNASPIASYVDVDTTGWAQGIQRKFRVRGYDARGIRGVWSNYTATVTLNTAPNAPVISYPAAGSTVYNKRPHVLLKAGAVNDGPDNILCLTDTAEHTTAADGALFSCGVNSDLTTDQKVVYVPGVDYGAAPSLSSRMYDSFLYSGSVSRSFVVATFAPTDADLTGAGMPIKAVHITDLRTAINNLRTAYGLASASWTAMQAGITLIGNVSIITELQTALQAVIDLVNGWDTSGTSFDLSVTWVNPASAGGGVDRIKLRQAIEQIRSTIILI